MRPDILVVMTDQQRWDSLGYAGNRFVRTPNLDALAARSLRFRNAVTPFPLCSPARAGLWTGLHAHRHGVLENVYQEPDALGARGCGTVPAALQAAGYRTGYVGKWHLGDAPPAGFDHWSGYNSALSHWIGDGAERVWRPHDETSRALDRMREWRSGPPFLLVVSYYPPHPPYDAPDRELARYRGSGIPHPAYYAAVDALDGCVGQLLASIPPQRPTVVLFCADHGETFRIGGGSKRSAEEAALRVPLLLALPSGAEGDVEAPVSLLDVAPTLAALAGVRFPCDGEDLAALAGGRVARPAVVVENVAVEPVGTRAGNLRQQVGVVRRAERAVWSGRDKLVLRDAAAPVLRDLVRDPEERFNRWRDPDRAPMLNSMLDALATHADRTDDSEAGALVAGMRRLLG